MCNKLHYCRRDIINNQNNNDNDNDDHIDNAIKTNSCVADDLRHHGIGDNSYTTETQLW